VTGFIFVPAIGAMSICTDVTFGGGGGGGGAGATSTGSGWAVGVDIGVGTPFMALGVTGSGGRLGGGAD
jgi:hypothetical protein